MPQYLIVKDKDDAWNFVTRLFTTEFLEDPLASQCAGYPVYYPSAAENKGNWICELHDRLEINFKGGDVLYLVYR